MFTAYWFCFFWGTPTNTHRLVWGHHFFPCCLAGVKRYCLKLSVLLGFSFSGLLAIESRCLLQQVFTSVPFMFLGCRSSASCLNKQKKTWGADHPFSSLKVPCQSAFFSLHFSLAIFFYIQCPGFLVIFNMKNKKNDVCSIFPKAKVYIAFLTFKILLVTPYCLLDHMRQAQPILRTLI